MVDVHRAYGARQVPGCSRPPASSSMSRGIWWQRMGLRSPREIPQPGADRSVHNGFDQHFADAPFAATPDRHRYRAPCRRDRIRDVNERECRCHAGKKLQDVALHSISPLQKLSPIPSSITPGRQRTEGQKVPPKRTKCSGPGAAAESLREEFTIDTARDSDHDQPGVGWILSADSVER